MYFIASFCLPFRLSLKRRSLTEIFYGNRRLASDTFAEDNLHTTRTDCCDVIVVIAKSKQRCLVDRQLRKKFQKMPQVQAEELESADGNPRLPSCCILAEFSSLLQKQLNWIVSFVSPLSVVCVEVIRMIIYAENRHVITSCNRQIEIGRLRNIYYMSSVDRIGLKRK